MSVNRLFNTFSVFLVLLILLLLWRTTEEKWDSAISGKSGLLALDQLHRGLILAELVSKERGPANALMGADDMQRKEALSRHNTARENSDRVFAELKQMLRDDPDTQRAGLILADIEKVQDALRLARDEVDTVAAIPYVRRNGELIRGSIYKMFAIVPGIIQPMYRLSYIIQKIFPDIGEMVEGARNCAELREYAGQLGSQFAGPLKTRKPLAAHELFSIYNIKGRINQLRELLTLRVEFSKNFSSLRSAKQEIDDHYFGKGLELISDLTKSGEAGRSYSISAAELLTIYVPTMSSIVTLRDVFMNEAVARAQKKQSETYQMLSFMMIAGVAALCILVVMLLIIRHRIIMPLQHARILITSLAEKDMPETIHFHKSTREVAEVFSAIEILRQRNHERINLYQELHRASSEIKNLLTEKEIMLKEVHHRIKNNMMTIKGLLCIQAGTLTDSSAVAALHDAESRVGSMMVLYDKLYLSESFQELSIKEYLPVLVNQIIDNFPDRKKVVVENHIDDFSLKAATLFTLGIMLNELLTNIMKYAFTGRDSGVITISALLHENHVLISIADNGIGMPESIGFENSTGFGMQLVGMLTTQVGGIMKIERVNGTKFMLEFDL